MFGVAGVAPVPVELQRYERHLERQVVDMQAKGIRN